MLLRRFCLLRTMSNARAKAKPGRGGTRGYSSIGLAQTADFFHKHRIEKV